MATQAPRKEISRKDLGDNYVDVTFEGGETEKMLVFAADHEAKRYAAWGDRAPSGTPAAHVEKGQVNPIGGMSRATRDALARIGHEGTSLASQLAQGKVIQVDGRELALSGKEIVDLLDKAWKHSLSPLLPVLPEWMEDDLADVLAAEGVSIELAERIGNALSEKFKARAQGMGGQVE